MKIGLQLQINLENLTNFRADGDDFRWYMKLKCMNCGEKTDNFQYLSTAESQPTKGGRGSASLVIKCRLCARENTIDILTESLSIYTSDDVGKFKTMVAFDCRGVEPIDFSPRVGFVAKSLQSNTVFTEIDLSDGDWCEYDEKSKMSVGVYDLQHQYIKLK